jgi:hypothetical protein
MKIGKLLPRLIVVAVGVLLVAAIPAFGSHADTTAVQTATGCINSLHKLIKVALGETPSSACSSGQTQVTLAGGDITSITAGTGLTGGGTEGDVTLNASLVLRQGPDLNVPNNSVGTTFAGCLTDEDAVAGAARWDSPSAGTVLLLVGPSFRNDGTVGAWRVDGHNTSGAARTLVAYVTCMKK